jgi:hypothetical protein
VTKLLILLSITVPFFFFFCIIIIRTIFKKKMQHWIWWDIKRGLRQLFDEKPKAPIHIMFALVDHFEPGNRNATLDQQKKRVDAWVKRYPKLAARHQDSDGICPQHTFFFPPHYDFHDHLEKISKLCSQGFGEIEMHLHHDRMEPWPDDELSLKRKILECIEAYSRYGIFCLPNNQKAYGFIHGDWALANSLKNGEHCGVNDEISILEDTGCYADFTFPVSNESQPKMANTIFYGKSSPLFPKGYDRHAISVKSGSGSTEGLMFIQGIIGLRWKSRAHMFKPSVEQSNIGGTDLPFRGRIDYWIRKAIHIQKKPNWIFIKIHGHGASSEKQVREVLLDRNSDDMFEYLEKRYNDGEKYVLHYVSAREMYNIIKAAENGEEGNPHHFRDYIIPRYVYLPERISSNPS